MMRVRILGGLVACALAVAGCAGEESMPAPATTGGGTGSSSPESGPACDDSPCSLAEAGERAGLLVGTAAKLDDEERRDLQVREFDAITSETEFLWSVIHPEPDVWNFDGADEVVAFAEEHDLDLTATHFLWDPPSIPDVLPDWVREISDPGELRAVMREHFTVLHERYGGRIDRWNVVNEPLALDGAYEENAFFEVLGPGYVAEAFALAEEIWPEADLVLNQDSVEYLPARAEALVALVAELQAMGVRVDRVGLQGHLFLGEPDWPLVEDTLAQLAALGVTVDITEIDVPLYGLNANAPPIDLEEQAARAARLVRACLDVESCASITFWGFDDGDTWLDSFIGPGTQPLLFDENLEPKPMYDAVLDELVVGR